MSSKKIKRVPRNDRQIRKLYGNYMGVSNTYSKTMQLFTHSEQRTRILKNYVFWKSLATIFGGKHNRQLLVFTQQTAIEAYQRLEHWKYTNSDITQSDINRETEKFMAMFP